MGSNNVCTLFRKQKLRSHLTANINNAAVSYKPQQQIIDFSTFSLYFFYYIL